MILNDIKTTSLLSGGIAGFILVVRCIAGWMCFSVEGWVNLDYLEPMTPEIFLKKVIRDTGIPNKRIEAVTAIINNGLELFREYKTNFYYSHTGKKVKKPHAAHATKIGRYDQKGARTF